MKQFRFFLCYPLMVLLILPAVAVAKSTTVSIPAWPYDVLTTLKGGQRILLQDGEPSAFRLTKNLGFAHPRAPKIRPSGSTPPAVSVRADVPDAVNLTCDSIGFDHGSKPGTTVHSAPLKLSKGDRKWLQ